MSLRKRWVVVWHPESPGVKLIVRRGPVARALKGEFASLSEAIKYPAVMCCKPVGTQSESREDLLCVIH